MVPVRLFVILHAFVPITLHGPVAYKGSKNIHIPAKLSDQYDIPGALADLKTCLEGGSVSRFGGRLLNEGIAQEDNSSPAHSPKNPWWNAWHRIRRYIISKDTAHKDIELSNIGGLGGV